MAKKTMNIGNSTTEVDVIASGKVVGENIKNKGSASTPVYFDGEGVAQPVTVPNRTYYCTCSTAAGTAAKVVTCVDTSFSLENGVIIVVTSSASNSASNVTLNVNNTGAKPIRVNNATYTSTSTSYCGYASRQITYIYDGIGWAFLTKSWDSNTTYTFQDGYNATTNPGATVATVNNAIAALPEPMIFKGSLGTGGTITDLPAAASTNEGFTYKVITAGTYASQAAKVGDTFISDGTFWVLIPSGDEPSGTVTSVGMTVPTGLSVSGSPITSSGTLAVSYASGYSIPTTTKQSAWDSKYDKPSGGIPKTDLASTVQTSLGKADTALQSHQSLADRAVNKTLTNENLNNVTTPGFYNMGGGNSVTNKPSGVDHCGLMVVHDAGGAYYTQKIFTDTTQYTRKCVNGTWGAWTEDKLTDTTYESKAAASGGTAVSLVTTGEKYTWNNAFKTFVITEDMVTVTTDETKGVAPYSTSYGYTNIEINNTEKIKWVEGALYIFVIDTLMLVTSANRNVRVRIGDSGSWMPVFGNSSILGGHSYFTKDQHRIFVFKSTYQTNGALHLISDSNNTYAYLVNTITGDTTACPIKIDANGYGARYSLIFPTEPINTSSPEVWSSLVKSSSTGTTKAIVTPTSKKFYADRMPLYIYSANVAANSKPVSNIYQTYTGLDLRYTYNTNNTYLTRTNKCFLWLKDFNINDMSFVADATIGNIVSLDKLETRFPTTVKDEIYLFFLGWTTATWYSLSPDFMQNEKIYKYTPSTKNLELVTCKSKEPEKGGEDLSLCTTGEKWNWNNKTTMYDSVLLGGNFETSNITYPWRWIESDTLTTFIPGVGMQLIGNGRWLFSPGHDPSYFRKQYGFGILVYTFNNGTKTTKIISGPFSEIGVGGGWEVASGKFLKYWHDVGFYQENPLHFFTEGFADSDVLKIHHLYIVNTDKSQLADDVVEDLDHEMKIIKNTTFGGLLSNMHNSRYVVSQEPAKTSNGQLAECVLSMQEDTNLVYYVNKQSIWYTGASSKRFKHNIQDMTEERAKQILNLRPVTFDYNNNIPTSTRKTDKAGLIAEEVSKITDDVVVYETSKEGFKIPHHIEYGEITPYLIKMCQIQQREIDELKEEIKKLKED